MRNGYETKDGKRIIAYQYITSTEIDKDGDLSIYHVAADSTTIGIDGLKGDDVKPFLAGFRAFLADDVVTDAQPGSSLPVVRTAADVLALLPAARQLRTEVRVVEGFVQVGTQIPNYSRAWQVIGTPGEAFDQDAVNAVFERLQR